MECRFAPEISRVENLEEIEFSAARCPTAAIWIRTVLRSKWYLSIEQPDCGHILVETGFVSERH